MEKITIKAIKYRTSIFVNVILLLILCFIGLANAQDSAVKTKSDVTSRAEKTSSSNVHVDEIVIKSIPAVQSGKAAISDDEQNKLVDTISHKATEKTINWLLFSVSR